MERIQRINFLIDKGYTYEPETGIIRNKKGKQVLKKKKGYIIIVFQTEGKKYQVYGHQFAYYYIYGESPYMTDHINGIKDDNRICNLREITNQQNQFNSFKGKGYYWHKRIKLWRAHIKVDGVSIHLGYFKDEIDAKMKYLEAKKKYHQI